jgi:hypothetical protein
MDTWILVIGGFAAGFAAASRERWSSARAEVGSRAGRGTP